MTWRQYAQIQVSILETGPFALPFSLVCMYTGMFSLKSDSPLQPVYRSAAASAVDWSMRPSINMYCDTTQTQH